MSPYHKILIIDITTSISSALSINVLLILDVDDLNNTLFLKISFLFLALSSSSLQQLLRLSQQYMHHYSHINLILKLKF